MKTAQILSELDNRTSQLSYVQDTLAALALIVDGMADVAPQDRAAFKAVHHSAVSDVAECRKALQALAERLPSVSVAPAAA